MRSFYENWGARMSKDTEATGNDASLDERLVKVKQDCVELNYALSAYYAERANAYEKASKGLMVRGAFIGFIGVSATLGIFWLIPTSTYSWLFLLVALAGATTALIGERANSAAEACKKRVLPYQQDAVKIQNEPPPENCTEVMKKWFLGKYNFEKRVLLKIFSDATCRYGHSETKPKL